ncbi:MAG: efflux RND transporter periplasmic adaptor subunit [Burkholderiales bacterium]|nr:efflux RND transporter periplasmic adaptor subunit [Opitutaceae bacterium]
MLALATPLALGLVGCKPDASAPAGASARTPQKVEVITLARADLRETLEVTGTLEANESVAIQPELAGIVREIAFEEGQRVEKGALLARLDDAELRAQVAEAEARADLARINRERADALATDGTLAQAEIDRVRSEERSTVAGLELLRVRLARTRLTAPFAGVLGSRSLAAGDYATPTSVLTRIDDLSALKVTFRVPERSIPQVKVGTRVTASVRVGADERPVQTEGEVFFVSASIDPSVRASEVKAILRNPPPELRPGMFASVRILLSTRAQVLVVPEAALLAGQRGVQVIAVEQKDGASVARYVTVETGLRVGGNVEIRPVAPDTLEPGTPIVSSGAGALVLFPGAPLSPVARFVEMKDIGSEQP